MGRRGSLRIPRRSVIVLVTGQPYRWKITGSTTEQNLKRPNAHGASKKAVLYRMVIKEHIWPFGLKSLDLLEREGNNVEDHWLKPREKTEAFQKEHGVETTPQTFIDGRRIGGNDELRHFFGKSVPDPNTTSYKPVIERPLSVLMHQLLTRPIVLLTADTRSSFFIHSSPAPPEYFTSRHDAS